MPNQATHHGPVPLVALYSLLTHMFDHQRSPQSISCHLKKVTKIKYFNRLMKNTLVLCEILTFLPYSGCTALKLSPIVFPSLI